MILIYRPLQYLCFISMIRLRRDINSAILPLTISHLCNIMEPCAAEQSGVEPCGYRTGAFCIRPIKYIKSLCSARVNTS